MQYGYAWRASSLSATHRFTHYLCGLPMLLPDYLCTEERKKYLHQHLKGFFRHKERAGLFDETSSFDIRYPLTLGSISCISASLFIYDFFSKTDQVLYQVIPHYVILCVYILCLFLTIGAKTLLSQFINWIFFDKERNKTWITAYFDLLSGASLILFPLALLIITLISTLIFLKHLYSL